MNSDFIDQVIKNVYKKNNKCTMQDNHEKYYDQFIKKTGRFPDYIVDMAVVYILRIFELLDIEYWEEVGPP